jgi:BirA family biotin operon repressor/biotin-[acetyl-CoA-carboxylase] ligase
MIDSVTNRGYCLSHGSDILSEAVLRGYLHDCPPLELDVFDTVDSTNTVCLKRASGGDRRTYAAVAGGQTRGRGRRGRSFFSPDGTGLYMSILLRPSGLSADEAVKFTTIAAVAVSEAIEAVACKTASIKWVNDIYVSGRKACGILTEASFNPEDGTLDYAVVGIGINVYEPQGGFPEEIKDRAGALAGPVNRNNLPAGKEADDPSLSGKNPADSAGVNKVLKNGGRNRLAAEILSRFFSYLDEGYVMIIP